MNSPYWFEVAVIFCLTTVGNILLGHFETESPKWRKIVKAFGAAGLAVIISATLGRAWFFILFGAMMLVVVIIHAWWLPSKGVNGWTAEPRERYYKLRGWKLK
jgi:hypothetical protein